MFVPTSSKVQKRSSSGIEENYHSSSSDELIFDLEDITSLCGPRSIEVHELALDISSKMVESWLDPNIIIQDQSCSCTEDVLSYVTILYDKNDNLELMGPSIDSVEPDHKSTIKKPPEKRSNEEHDKNESTFDQTAGNSNEKRPRCNTGDKTASRSTSVSRKIISPGQAIGSEYFDLIALQLPIIVRLCLACPFVKIREKSLGILKSLMNKGLPIPLPTVYGPSEFIPYTELPFMGTCNQKSHTLFVDAFLQNNRLDHVSQVMGYHPSYLEKFLQTQNYILRGDGPLSFDYRHFIAIMAAGRHQCSYLIALQKQEFLLQGGDHNWLRGLSCIPQKLRNLYDINKILAHRPWLLKTSHIEKLTKCGKDSWSLAEVVHAIVILTHFHSLCSFVFSCGVNQELDQGGGYVYPGTNQSPMGGSPSTKAGKGHDSNKSFSSASSQGSEDWLDPVGASPPSPTEPEVGITTLMQRMKTLSEQTEECTPVELAKRFENIEVQSAELGVVGPEPQETPADISYFIEDPSFQYQDFAKRIESDIHTFRVQDYSWDDHGYSTVNRLYNDVGTLLDSKFKTAYNLTYYTMGGRTDVDTSRFRRAIWNYIQALLGIRHDDYDYAEIEALVEKSLKSFMKTACCYPERVTKKVYDRVMREFEHSEKVHVNLMVLESRMQAELIYALRTVNRYMTK